MTGDAVIRTAIMEDLPAILSIEALCRSVTWSPDGFASELSDAHSLCLVSCAGDDRVCGYALSRCAADECTIHTIAILPSCQRQGIGRLLMRELLARAALLHIATLFLEVRSKNTGARAFYAALGFSSGETRRAYYNNDRDDAIIMSRLIPR
jgi:ribosomal-protein-alanine N-acetyltransferase